MQNLKKYGLIALVAIIAVAAAKKIPVIRDYV